MSKTWVLTADSTRARLFEVAPADKCLNEPGHPRRHFRIGQRQAEGNYVGPDEWLANTPANDGSWWPPWVGWLDQRSQPPIAPPDQGNATCRLSGFVCRTGPVRSRTLR